MKNSSITFLKRITILLLFLSMQITVFAQNQFISVINKQILNLTEVQTSKLNKLEGNPVYKSIDFVRIGKIEELLTNGELYIDLPNQNGSFTAHVKEFEYKSEKEYVWKGDIIDYDGNIVIFCQKGEIFGHIVFKNKEYEIQSFGNNTIFIEIDMNYVLKSKCGNHTFHSPKKEQKDETTEKGEKNRSNTGLVRILVLYTSNAQNAVSNISQTATLAVNQINTALYNSDITYSQLHVQKANTKYLSFTENPSDISDDVENQLRNNSTAQYYRNLYQADLVVLLTDGNYHNGPYYYAGRVADIGPNNSYAYAIVEADYATSNLTFAHEVAHLFGARHQNDTNGSYEHGYYFTTGWWFWKKYYRTILGTYSNTYNRIQYYSNPDVEYNNKATGTSSSNDVARKLKTTSNIVENFRPYTPPPPTFNVHISGPTKGNNNGTYTWSAIVSGGTASSYLWKYGYDGVNYNNTFGTTQSITAGMPFDNDLYLKLTVTSTIGGQAIDYHLTINMSDIGHKSTSDDSVKTVTTDNMNITKHSDITTITINNNELNQIERIYPNPAKTKTSFQYFAENKGKADIIITNIAGKLIDKFFQNVNKGFNVKEIDVSKYENGIYFIHVNTNSSKITYKLLINK
jgi:hypothetical protein